VDRPQATWARYRGVRPKIDYAIWGPRFRPRHIWAGQHALYVATTAPARIHFGSNGWQNVRDIITEDTGLGVYVAELPAETLQPGDSLQFTFFWPERGAWEGQNYEVAIESELEPA
jgi:glucoamylase